MNPARTTLSPGEAVVTDHESVPVSQPQFSEGKGTNETKAIFTCLARLASRLRGSLRVLSGGREHAREAVGQPGRNRKCAVGSAAACAGEAEASGGSAASLELAVKIEEGDELPV